MISYEERNYKLFYIWLYTSLLLVFFMIVVGGLTRLTNSGLSITEWELFTGILPPLTEQKWVYYFSLYKKIPQFELLNNSMTMDEFKIIFYWEYFHRVLGRLIGLFFLIPLIYFYLTKKISNKYLNICILIMCLIIFQGFLGWYMVKSGLINNVTVSHYRLASHLGTAFLIILLIFWTLLNVKNFKFKIFFENKKRNYSFYFLFLLLFFQIILGAFVSGLDAGLIYQTWPLMNSSYFPDDYFLKTVKDFFNFENHGLVQFYHRNLAYLITLYIFVMGVYFFKRKFREIYKHYYIVLFFLFFQIFLGIFTLISGLNIYLASLHQIFSLLLTLSVLNLYYKFVK